MTKVRVDAALCQGHAQCERTAPGLFELDDDGYAVVKIAELTTADLVTNARLAADACPEQAITVLE